jgi:hypothetical protein
MIKNMGKEEKIILVSSVFLLAFAAVYICLAQWTEPSASPPSGNVDAPINTGSSHQGKLAGNIYAAAFYSSTGGDYFLDLDTPSATSTIAGDLTVEGNGNFGTTTIGGGSGKINVGTIDPIFEIKGEKYASYVSDYAGGTRIDTTGIFIMEDKQDEIFKKAVNFDDQEKGSDIWLFWQASNKNMGDVAVILTPSFEGDVWYEKKENRIEIYSQEQGEISFRFSAPRFDHEKWDNVVEDPNLIGLEVK